MLEFHGTRGDLARLLGAIPTAMGGSGDPYAVAVAIQLRAGVSLLSQIQQAFVVKSRGGTGSDGVKWKPLKPATIAQRRIGKGDLAAIGVRGTKIPKNRVRGLLTPAQDRRWRQVYGTRLARFMASGMSGNEARAAAARIAWAVVKSEGAQTKLQVLGGRQVDIGRDTSRMFRSIAAGQDARNVDDPAATIGKSGEAEQVFLTPPARVIVGSNCPYLPKFHQVRPVWPAGGKLPAPWADAVSRSIRAGIVRAIVLLVERGRVL